MFAKTVLNNCSIHGYKTKVLKSAICKYFRRGEFEKLKWSIMEMAYFNNLDEKAVKGIITNLINRLKILLMEDMSVVSAGITVECIKILDNYDVNRYNYDLLLDFCELIKYAKRNRFVSYLGNWWRNKGDPAVDTDIKISYVLKYKKHNDSQKLLMLGENLIKYIKEGDERMFGVYNLMYNLDETAGIRYRRKDPVYMWWEILRDFSIDNKKIITIIDFARSRFYVKSMKERVAFGVWAGLLVWKREYLEWNIPDVESADSSIKYYNEMKKLEIDDYVVNDYHVNKKFDLVDFAMNGAMVVDENMDFIENYEAYRKFYIECKKKQAESPKPRRVYKKKKIDKKTNVMVPNYEFISWDEFSDITVLEDGVCGGKVCCIRVTYNNTPKVLKELGKSMNYGADYIVVDKCKSLFGLKDLGMELINSDVSLVKIDKSKRSFVGNWELKKVDTKPVYALMNYYENIGDLGKNKNILKNESIAYEYMKIRLFDGLFRSSDNIMRNILLTSDDTLISIDENDIYGKREMIFNKRGEWHKKNMKTDVIEKIIDDLMYNFDSKKKFVIKILEKYSMGHHKDEFCNRFDNYRKIVMNEIK